MTFKILPLFFLIFNDIFIGGRLEIRQDRSIDEVKGNNTGFTLKSIYMICVHVCVDADHNYLVSNLKDFIEKPVISSHSFILMYS